MASNNRAAIWARQSQSQRPQQRPRPALSLSLSGLVCACRPTLPGPVLGECESMWVYVCMHVLELAADVCLVCTLHLGAHTQWLRLRLQLQLWLRLRLQHLPPCRTWTCLSARRGALQASLWQRSRSRNGPTCSQAGRQPGRRAGSRNISNCSSKRAGELVVAPSGTPYFMPHTPCTPPLSAACFFVAPSSASSRSDTKLLTWRIAFLYELRLGQVLKSFFLFWSFSRFCSFSLRFLLFLLFLHHVLLLSIWRAFRRHQHRLPFGVIVTNGFHVI